MMTKKLTINEKGELVSVQQATIADMICTSDVRDYDQSVDMGWSDTLLGQVRPAKLDSARVRRMSKRRAKIARARITKNNQLRSVLQIAQYAILGTAAARRPGQFNPFF